MSFHNIHGNSVGNQQRNVISIEEFSVHFCFSSNTISGKIEDNTNKDLEEERVLYDAI
jgi:hypothetical protein